MYRIVKVDGAIKQSIDKTGVPNRYGEPKLFKTKKMLRNGLIKKVIH